MVSVSCPRQAPGRTTVVTLSPFRRYHGSVDTTPPAPFSYLAWFTAEPGGGAALIAILLEAARSLQENDACLLYLIHRTLQNPDVVLVTEVWTDQEAHDAALTAPHTVEIIARARALILTADVTSMSLMGGVGLG